MRTECCNAYDTFWGDLHVCRKCGEPNPVMVEPPDRFIVTLFLEESDGTVTQTSHSTYGSSGMVEAIETVDWDIKKGHSVRGTVQRVLPEGGTKFVYERFSNASSYVS